MLLYVLQNPASPIYPHELAFRFPVSEQDAATFSARLAALGWLYQTPRRIKRDRWYYGIHPDHVPRMRSAVATAVSSSFEAGARSHYLSLTVLYHPYRWTKPAVRPSDRVGTRQTARPGLPPEAARASSSS